MNTVLLFLACLCSVNALPPGGDKRLYAHPNHDPVLKDNSFAYARLQKQYGDEAMPNLKGVKNEGTVTSKHPDKYPAADMLVELKAGYSIGGYDGKMKRNYVLVVEDMEEGYRQWIQYVIPEAKLLLDQFRKMELPVVWTNWARRPDDGHYGSIDRFYGPRGIKDQTNPAYMYGPGADETVEELKPLTDDERSREIVSLHLSKFADKDEHGNELLDPMLRAWGVTTIVLLGAWTDDCIAATAFEAVDRYGYDLIMVYDAVATATTNGNKMRNILCGAVALCMDAKEIVDFMEANPQLIDKPKRPLNGNVRFEKPYVRTPEEFLGKDEL